MAVEYDISSDVAVIKETGSVSQCARVTQMYSGQITYDDEAGSKFATATINGKSQRVMLCIAVNGTVTYDDVPSLYSTVDGHRCLNIVTPTETGTPDDVPSLYETVVIDGQNVRAVRCIMINKTPVYDGVSSTCTFTGDDGKTHTAQLVNKVTGGSVQVIIKGTSPLVLPDAIANSLSYVKAFGGTEQNGTPTPDTPVDIVSNNGVLRIQGSATGTVTQTGTPTPTEPIYPVFYQKGDLVLRAVDEYADTYDATTQTITRRVGVKVFDGTETFGTTNATFTCTISGRVAARIAVLCSHFEYSTKTSSQVEDMKIITFNSTNIGFRYDACANTTAFQQWLADQYAAGTPVIVVYPLETPMTESFTPGVYADGTVETINAHTTNIFNKNDTENIGSWYSGSNQTITQAAANETLVMRAKPNTTYYFKHCSVKGGCRAFYTEVEDWEIGSACSAMSGNAGANANVVYSITTSANAKWIFFNYGRNNLEASLDDQRNDFMVSTSGLTSDTPYEQYFNGGTATAEMLLKVGDYQDEQEILSGAITRNVGVKVFDGSESCSIVNNTFRAILTGLPKNNKVICNYFDGDVSPFVTTSNQPDLTVKGNGSNNNTVYFKYAAKTTVADFQQWLADRYAAGTPVIVVYPLDEPTTESVTGQTLQVTDGDNTLEITQASLTGLELEAQYDAAVSLTIQEVQDANLDNNVTVTIQ